MIQVGDRYGRLVVLERVGTVSTKTKKQALWRCRCDCGREVEKTTRLLTRKGKNEKSCGCLVNKAPNRIQVGDRFGKLTVLHYAGKKQRISKGKIKKENLWVCKCDCGNLTFALQDKLIGGSRKSCGCLIGPRQAGGRKLWKHNHRRLQHVWRGMITRCESECHRTYKDYGAKGIDVCNDWHDFDVFYEWAIENGYSEGLQLDRINNTEGYKPSNCRWVTAKENNRNKTNNVNLTINGETKCMSAWAEEYGIYPSLIEKRLKAGWNVERAVKTPSASLNQRKKHLPNTPIDKYDEHGNLVESFENSKDAAESVNGNRRIITNCANGNLRTYKGYVWRWRGENYDI